MDIIFILSIIAVTLFSLLGLYLIVTDKGNKMTNLFLGGFFLLWAIDFMDGSLLLKGFYLEHPNWALWSESFVFLYGPLIYFCALFTSDRQRKIRFLDGLHLLPFLMGLGLMTKVYYILPTANKIEILKGIVSLNQPAEYFVVLLVVHTHIFVYIFLSYLRLRRAIQHLKHYYSTPKLQWLLKLLFVLIGILAISIASSILQYFGATTFFYVSLILILLSMGILVGRLIFNALDQQSPLLAENVHEKYSGSLLTDGEALEIESKIVQALENEELFLDPELSLNQLSETIAVGRRKVSQVINEKMGISFFDLINAYRIDRAKHIFGTSKDQKLTVLEVLYEVGFNSKSSFNTQFKKRVGLTPTEFLRLNR